MIDIYKLLPEEWFEKIGDFSENEEEFAPINYDDVVTAIYCGNSFFGPEFVDLLVDDYLKIYYIRSAIRRLSEITHGRLFGHGTRQTQVNTMKSKTLYWRH